MKRLVSTKDMSHEEWLAFRKKGIGGSDAGAICGKDPYCSAIDVWMDKTNPEIEDKEQSEAMRLGKDLEDYVAHRWMEKTGKTVRNNNHILQHDDYPFMLANIDREVVGERALLECKTAMPYTADKWADENTPESYTIQCLHYLAVTGYERCYLACLIYGRGVVMRVIERDEEAIASLISIEKNFWKNHVEAKVMPAPDGSAAAEEAIKTIYAEGNPDIEEIDLTGEFTLNRIDEIDGLIADLTEEKSKLVQDIQCAMKEAETARIDGRKITWKTYKGRRSFDSKKFKEDHADMYDDYMTTGKPYRVFKIGKPVPAERGE